ncbi:MAG TPA: pantoate--beta-alanine ligase [Acidiferrobacteraceae bacterium]|nr:pantoate--beta-alanine ligase [Acidiferrobacteraceae bacterium]
MDVARNLSELNAALENFDRCGARKVFVPTMGNLHDGHLHLMTEARRYGDGVVASVYVNPMQFGPGEDFESYPRTEKQDLAQLKDCGVDLVFMPDISDIYPREVEAHTTVEVPELGAILCGASRPGHFRGVTTVVNRLFNLVAPQAAVFGKKDYQQWLLIRLMVADLGMPIEVIGVDTVRGADGLALSSRNGYLSEAERAIAPKLYETLGWMAGQISEQGAYAGDFLAGIESQARDRLQGFGFDPDYISVRRQGDLGVPQTGDQEWVILAAAQLGKTRLIDNLEVNLKPSD